MTLKGAAMPKRPLCLRHPGGASGRQLGAIGIMFAGALIVLFSFFALALDLSQLYNRKMELQIVADTVALAAASELNGTAAGIANALLKGADPFNAYAVPATYQYGHRRMTWSDAAMEFGASPAGPWQSSTSPGPNVANLLYVKVDTSKLNDAYGAVSTIFIRVAGGAGVTSTSTRAIAGRSAIKVTPLGICALRSDAHRNHNGELEEFGFRRGVAYNLMNLNRTAAAATPTAGATFIVNPLPGMTPVTSVATLAPFVCTGTMAMARIMGGPVTVSSAFPLANLFDHLNSRFGTTGSAAVCNTTTAPADMNVKEYLYNTGAPWMSATPLQQAAVLLNEPGRRWNVAGPDAAPAGTTANQFGPLWAYAKAARYASYLAVGVPEPTAGYSTYEVADWATLYNPGQPKTSAVTPYPTDVATPTPYSYRSGTVFFKGPLSTNKSLANRRVLNLPLLACPVAGSQATVLGIGKFFMTVAATSTTLYGEFAGIASEQLLGTRVLLYP